MQTHLPSQQEPPQRIALKVGEVYELRLRGRGSAGYVWECSVDGPQGVVSISHGTVGERLQATPGGPPPDSYSLDDQFSIKADSSGSVRLSFVQSRPWESSLPPMSQFQVDVTITKP